MSYFSDPALQHEETAIKKNLIRDSEMVKIALSLALRNASTLFNTVEASRGYNLDCEKLDNIEQKIQNLIDEVDSLIL